jgi:hypothetical protein
MDLEDDGLLLPEVGEWSERKYRLIASYAAMFATAMRGKWKTRTYVDLFAGAGRAKIKGSQRIVATSATLALDVPHPFDGYVLCELDPRKAEALQRRVARIVQKLWSLLPRPARRRAVVPGLPRAAHLPALPQDGRRARAAHRRGAAHPQGLPLGRPRAPQMEGVELEQHYRETLRELGQQGGMLGLIFRKAQNKIQDPAKLRQLVVELIGKEQLVGDVGRREGRRLRGPARAQRRRTSRAARGSTSRRARSSTPSWTACARSRASRSPTRPAAPAASCSPRTSTSKNHFELDRDQKRTCATRRCAASSWSTTSRACAR